MRAFFVLAAAILIATPLQAADEKHRSSASTCYVADAENKPLQAEAVSLTTMQQQHPVVDVDEKTSKQTLRWGAMPPDVRVIADVIARYEGREIYRVLYKKGENGEYDFALLALDDSSNRNPLALRPFFLLPCDQVRWLEFTPVSYKACPFGVEVERTLQGTGVFTDTWLFKFSGMGARLVEQQEEGRHTEQKTHRYH